MARTPRSSALFRRALLASATVALASTAWASAALVAPSAHASTSDDLDAARQKLAQAKAAAQAVAGQYAQAESHEAELDQKIGGLQATIAAQKARAASLQQVARERAVYAYTHQHDQLDLVSGAEDAITAVRQRQLLEHANQTDNSAVRKLAAVNADLKSAQDELRKERAQADIVRNQLLSHNQELQAKLADAQAAADQLQAKLDAEIAIAREAEARAKLEAERAALAAQLVTTDAGGAGQIFSYPAVNGFMCPVSGAVFTDDYGGPRGHPGIDMFVPTGTPLVAAKAGTLMLMANDGAGGNEAYVTAADGNTYYYAHLSAYSGGAREVKQGEQIGLSGMTGNAQVPHLHFEIRVGGPNGTRIDPYPTLKASGC